MHATRTHVWTTLCLVCALVASAPPVCAVAAPASSIAQQTAIARARIGAMQKVLGASLSAYDAATAQLSRTRADIAANRRELTALEVKVGAGRLHLNAEANFLYRTDGTGFAEALLSASSFDQFTSRLVSLAHVASRDAALLGQIRRERASVARIAVELADRERRQSALVAAVAARRGSAQSALDRQQAYADTLSGKVSSALDGEHKHSSASSTPPPVSRDTHAVARATVSGRTGSYAVLASDPKSYRPTGLTFDGKATWYGNSRPNMGTASGRVFDERDFTCAHKSLPFGTRIAVTYRGRRVIVVVTDRGPYGRGRVIDLSKHAAAVIGLKSAGVGAVHCEVVRPG